MKRFKRLALGIWVAVHASWSWAQVTPTELQPALLDASTRTVTLSTAFEAAWQRAVSAREAVGQRRRADAARAAASSYWAAPPSLEIEARDDRWLSNSGEREAAVAVAWPLLMPGQRSARAAVAEADVALADIAQDTARLRLAGEVREAASTLVAVHAEVNLANTTTKALEAISADVERRVQAGDLARADALAARAEWLSETAQHAETTQRLAVARSRWLTLTGLSAAPVLDEAAPPTHAGSTLEAHPDMRLAAARTEAARQRLALLRTSRRDAPELTLGMKQEVAARGESAGYSMIVGVRVPLGTADRNRPLEAAALAELDVAEATERETRDRLASEQESARIAVEQAERQATAELERAGLLRERARLVEASFRAGETPLPDLLRAVAASSQADARVARQQAALKFSRARLKQTIGLLP
jgi:outer membrane protein TolC